MQKGRHAKVASPRESLCWGQLAFDERTNVFANPFGNEDSESAVCGHVKSATCGADFKVRGAIEIYRAIAGDDFHALRFLGTEVVVPWVDESEGLFGTVWEKNGVADDLSVEIDIGFGHGGDTCELGWDG